MPAKTPAEIVARLNAEVRAAEKVQKVIDGLRQTGYEPADQSPEAFAAFVRDDAKAMLDGCAPPRSSCNNVPRSRCKQGPA